MKIITNIQKVFQFDHTKVTEIEEKFTYNESLDQFEKGLSITYLLTIEEAEIERAEAAKKQERFIIQLKDSDIEYFLHKTIYIPNINIEHFNLLIKKQQNKI